MRYLLLLLGVGLVVWLQVWAKRRSFTEGPNRTAHLKQWDASEPVIRKLALPDVKALKATRAAAVVSAPAPVESPAPTDTSNVSEFRKRRARR